MKVNRAHGGASITLESQLELDALIDLTTLMMVYAGGGLNDTTQQVHRFIRDLGVALQGEGEIRKLMYIEAPQKALQYKYNAAQLG